MAVKTSAKTIRRVDAVWLNREIGRRIRRLRQQKGQTLAEVGIGLGVSRACLNNWELGRSQLNWNLTSLYNVALYFNVPIRRLLP